MKNTQLQTAGSAEYSSSPTPLQIPKAHIQTISKMLKLSDAAADQLIAALSSSTVTGGPFSVAEQIREKVSSIPFEDLTDIVGVVYTLYNLRKFLDANPLEFLNDLIEGIRVNPEFGSKASGDLSRIRDRFQRLLGIAALDTVSKALDLQRDGERLYCDAIIFSDIRPVFGEDVTSRPTGAVITHTLKLGYHGEKEHKEFFLVLDEEDLTELQQVIQRAQSKGKTLSMLLKEIGLPRLGR